MKYTKNHPSQDIAHALGLEKSQVTRLKNAIQKAYDELPNQSFNIDEITALVAPYIKTTEEGFFVATVIISDVMGAAGMLGAEPQL